MAATGSIGLQELLKPYHHRATEAEERLTRLEFAIGSNKNAQNEELIKKIIELEAKLENANAEVASEREKFKKLAAENAKLDYRVLHLVRAVKEADAKLERLTGSSDASGETTSRMKDLRL